MNDAQAQAQAQVAELDDASRITQEAVIPGAKEGGLRFIRSFIQLQPGGWGAWTAIWLLQNIRFAPIYILPLLTGRMIDSLDRSDPAKAYAWMPIIAAATLGMCVANIIGDTASRAMLSRISRGLTAGLREALLRRLNRLSLGFHERERMGQIETRFTLDMNRMEAFLGFLSEGVLMNATVLLVMAAIIGWTNPVLLVMIAVAAVLNLLLARMIWSRLRGAQEAYRRAEGSFLHRLGETLRGLRISRAHASEGFTEDRMRTEAREVARRGMALDMLVNLFGSSSWAIGTILSMGMLLIGAWLVVTPPLATSLLGFPVAIEPITLGQMTVLLSYYGIMAGSLAAIVNQVPAISGAHDAMRSLATLYEEEAEKVGSGADPGRVAGHIRFDGVSFGYGDGSTVLDRIDLDIPSGSSLALVGPSGGGKSTIASLVLGFYPPRTGTISIDGQDLHALDLRALRRQVGLVSQDPIIFNDTIVANIAWGDRKPDLHRVREAARMANAMEFIERMPGDIFHPLGERGANLSGGQRQRIAIARALYRDPRILILDEATSALDGASERAVQQALEQAMQGRTTIIIAHRLSTIRTADRIAVVAHGRIAESGSYDQLMARRGAFAEMVGGKSEAP